MGHRSMRRAVAILIGVSAGPVAAQDTWSDYTIATGQGAVLNSMNVEEAKRAHRAKGLPPPDFKAAERRLAARNARAKPVGRMTATQRAEKCSYVRARLAQLRPDQLATYRRVCP